MPLKQVPRRPPPSPLRLWVGPIPPRTKPKHTMPCPPRPTFFPARASVPDRPVGTWGSGLGFQSLDDAMLLPPSPTSPNSIDVTPQSPKLRGPWDRSRNLSESTLDINNIIRAPQPAAYVY